MHRAHRAERLAAARLARAGRPGLEIGLGAVVVADLAGAVRRLGGGDAVHHARVDVHFGQRQEQVEAGHRELQAKGRDPARRRPASSRGSRRRGRRRRPKRSAHDLQCSKHYRERRKRSSKSSLFVLVVRLRRAARLAKSGAEVVDALGFRRSRRRRRLPGRGELDLLRRRVRRRTSGSPTCSPPRTSANGWRRISPLGCARAASPARWRNARRRRATRSTSSTPSSPPPSFTASSASRCTRRDAGGRALIVNRPSSRAHSSRACRRARRVRADEIGDRPHQRVGAVRRKAGGARVEVRRQKCRADPQAWRTRRNETPMPRS